jgi:hypothetical protein
MFNDEAYELAARLAPAPIVSTAIVGNTGGALAGLYAPVDSGYARILSAHHGSLMRSGLTRNPTSSLAKPLSTSPIR